jgi:probable HAF family extracellular repeat protein
MPCSYRFPAALGLAILAALIPGRAAAAPMYTITDLGMRKVTGLNDAGQVVGSGSLSVRSAADGPFLYQNGTFTDLSGKLGASAWISGINNAGQIAGSTLTPTGGSYVFVLGPGGQLTRYDGAGLVAINNNGDTVVASGTHVFLNRGGTTTDLGGLVPGHSVVATGLSDAGQVIGLGGGGFLYQDGKLTGLGSLGGGDTATWGVSGVNAAGQVVGNSSTSAADPADTAHAFLYQKGKMTDLGTLGGPRSFAFGINSAGQVVGTSDSLPGSANPSAHAFLYENGTMFDLNKLVPSGSGWVLQGAQEINAVGQIVGNGIGPDGDWHSFLLTPAGETANLSPVPEPTTLAFFGLAAVGLAARRARRRSA